MCGIFASIGFEPDRRRIAMVAHRGPDGEGWEVFASPAGPVALGHRRLAIIDTSTAGLQPFQDQSGRHVITYNGEIYNYRALRAELEATGVAFHTETDTEVLLQALIRWGAGALPKLSGMFAFVYIDRQENRLIAARDRFGIKPLYVSHRRGGIAFASEIKQILDLAGPARANPARLADFLIDGITDHTNETLFAGIHQLRGGELLELELAPECAAPAPRRWYTLPPAGTAGFRRAEAAERFRDLLTRAVASHLQADVRIGSCLSGGLDSSSIVCLMAQLLGQGDPNLNTITAAYDERAVDERDHALRVAAQAGANAHLVFPKPDDLAARASDITWHQDEPFGSTSIFAQWCVFAGAQAEGVKVMLDGQGADETLAGYHGLFGLRMRDLLRERRFPEALRTHIGRWTAHNAPLLPPLGKVLMALRHGRNVARWPDWLSGDAQRHLDGRLDAHAAAADVLGYAQPTTIDATCRLITAATNLPMLLHWEDRNAMAHGIEARVPFVDHDLVEFALSLPADLKFDGATTKAVLRDAMNGILPEATRTRQDKLGFATPEAQWLRGPLRPFAEEGINRTLARFPALFDPDGLRGFARTVLNGQGRFDFTLWRIINLGLWGERFGVSV
ncbi:MAG: asparagine synthase (glutamine-hydrolyzing) [Proteobacteria bacterium]|nr:asparagine synthase (glutamine-hydrolyzing) [Pseudomonadota bacterium]